MIKQREMGRMIVVGTIVEETVYKNFLQNLPHGLSQADAFDWFIEQIIHGNMKPEKLDREKEKR